MDIVSPTQLKQGHDHRHEGPGIVARGLPGEIKQFDKGGKVLEAIGVRTPSNQSGLALFRSVFRLLIPFEPPFKCSISFSYHLLFLAFVTCFFRGFTSVEDALLLDKILGDLGSTG